MALFEILRRGPRPNKVLVMPNTELAEGIALQESATAGVAELADGTKPFAGFVCRPVKTAHTLTYAEIIGEGSQPLESPYLTSQEGACEDAEEVEAEGATYLMTSGGNAISTGTALKTPITFKQGRFAVADTYDYVHYVLVAKPTPEVSGNVRCRFQRVYGYPIPA